MSNIKYFNEKIGLQFNYTPLAVEQNNHATKIVNIYIINDLDYWPKLPLRSFTLNNRLFGAINIVKDGDKEKYVYGTYGMAFNEKGLWSLNDGFARNAIIFRG